MCLYPKLCRGQQIYNGVEQPFGAEVLFRFNNVNDAQVDRGESGRNMEKRARLRSAYHPLCSSLVHQCPLAQLDPRLKPASRHYSSACARQLAAVNAANSRPYLALMSTPASTFFVATSKKMPISTLPMA